MIQPLSAWREAVKLTDGGAWEPIKRPHPLIGRSRLLKNANHRSNPDNDTFHKHGLRFAGKPFPPLPRLQAEEHLRKSVVDHDATHF